VNFCNILCKYLQSLSWSFYTKIFFCNWIHLNKKPKQRRQFIHICINRLISRIFFLISTWFTKFWFSIMHKVHHKTNTKVTDGSIHRLYWHPRSDYCRSVTGTSLQWPQLILYRYLLCWFLFQTKVGLGTTEYLMK